MRESDPSCTPRFSGPVFSPHMTRCQAKNKQGVQCDKHADHEGEDHEVFANHDIDKPDRWA